MFSLRSLEGITGIFLPRGSGSSRAPGVRAVGAARQTQQNYPCLGHLFQWQVGDDAEQQNIPVFRFECSQESDRRFAVDLIQQDFFSRAG